MGKLETYIGAGVAHIRERGVAGAAWVPLGNAKKLDIEWKTSGKTLMDYMSRAGGTFDQVILVEGGDVNLELTQFFVDNLELMLYGESTDLPSVPVVDESHIWAGSGPVFLNDLPVAGSVVVKDDAAAVTYVAGVDYDLGDGGLSIIPRAGGAIVSGDELKISYTRKKSLRIEALVNTAKEFEAMVVGLNKADAVDGDPKRIHLRRVKFGPGNLRVVTDDFDAVAIKGGLLKDPNIIASGTSPYANITKAA